MRFTRAAWESLREASWGAGETAGAGLRSCCRQRTTSSRVEFIRPIGELVLRDFPAQVRRSLSLGQWNIRCIHFHGIL